MRVASVSEGPQETYLGAGVFASVDGWAIKLRAPRADADHIVYLERNVWCELLRYAADCWAPQEKSRSPRPHNEQQREDR